jgi:GAF domain-containing protein
LGARALPSALLSHSSDPTHAGTIVEPGQELERLRLENETLSAVVGLVSSGPDLRHILDRVVDLLTKAADCHACFVYLRAEGRLEMRAASPVYSHLVGKVGFGIEEGLAGWAVRRGEAAFIREGAIDDPRTHYVPELEEERFQSMIAIPIPSRDGSAIGAIVLHTVAPREFDERILNVLSRAASLVAGAIENARLYEDAQERVEALTRLAAFGREVAAISDRGTLFELAAVRIRELIGVDLTLLYTADAPGGRLRRVTAAPVDIGAEVEGEGELTDNVLDGGDRGAEAAQQLLDALSIGGPSSALDAVELSIGAERTGAIVVSSSHAWPRSTRELLRAAAQQVALAAEKIALIEHLTEENVSRDLFDALASGQLAVAAEKAQAAGLPSERPAFVIEVQQGSIDIERELRRTLPQAFCDLSSGSLRALLPGGATGVDAVRPSIEALDRSGVLKGIAVGVSEARVGIKGMAEALGEASDAAKVADRLGQLDAALLYRDTGAYRYLIDLLDEGGPRDQLRDGMEVLAGYDLERGTHLLATLDEYLSNGRVLAATARKLFVHVNTLRQRLDRIEELTGLRVGEEELLMLLLAVKLSRTRDNHQSPIDPFLP